MVALVILVTGCAGTGITGPSNSDLVVVGFGHLEFPLESGTGCMEDIHTPLCMFPGRLVSSPAARRTTAWTVCISAIDARGFTIHARNQNLSSMTVLEKNTSPPNWTLSRIAFLREPTTREHPPAPPPQT